jgi:hypothetical protein
MRCLSVSIIITLQALTHKEKPPTIADEGFVLKKSPTEAGE